MSFYEHFFWNYAIVYQKPWAWKVGVGGGLPDLIYMVAFLPKIFFYQSFREWMHDPLWDKLWNSFIARSVHSLTIWGAIVLLCWIVVEKELFRQIFPFIGGWGLHIVVDALTHVSDGYAIFFPLSGYRFPAFVSYWEREFHAREFFVTSHSLMAGFLLLWLGSKLKQFFSKRRWHNQKR